MLLYGIIIKRGEEEMKKNKKSRRVFQILMLVLLNVLVVCILLAIINLKKQANQTDDNTNVESNGLYVAPSNMTDYQKELYEELSVIVSNIKDIENEDLSDLSASVAKNFIADYFSWGNKRGSYDIGGIDFVYGPYHNNFAFNARDYFYNDLDLILNQYGSENLPLVDNIVIDSVEKQDEKYAVSILAHDYTNDTDYYEDNYYDAYLVKAHWDYKIPTDSSFDLSKFPTNGNLMMVLRDGRIELGYFHEKWIRELGDE